MTTKQSTPELIVPDDVASVFTCPHCDRPFPEERLRDLHLGEAHPAVLSGDEHEAYETARSDESDSLFVLHLAVVGFLVVVFFLIAYLYVFVMV